MPIKNFSFPVPETRFFQVGRHIYKFKIRRGSKNSGEEELLDSLFVSEELENAVRVVLVSLDNLHPFTTQHFNIFPYKSRWERVSELRFKRGEKKFFPYPFIITLYVETIELVPQLTVVHANEQVPQLPASFLPAPTSEPKRRKTDGPQEGSLCKDHQYEQMDTHRPLYFEQLPYLTDGAEEMTCGNKLCARSEESSRFIPVARNLEFDDEQVHPEMSDKFTEKQTQGVLARLARHLTRCVTLEFLVIMLPVALFILLMPLSWSDEGLQPGCHLRPFNVTIRSDRRGTCRGTQVAHACVGYCESSAFPSPYSVLLASNFKRNVSSVSSCCTISKLSKVKVRVECPHSHHHVEILTARACHCDMCHKIRQ